MDWDTGGQRVRTSRAPFECKLQVRANLAAKLNKQKCSCTGQAKQEVGSCVYLQQQWGAPVQLVPAKVQGSGCQGAHSCCCR